jgi:hypothetical protein
MLLFNRELLFVCAAPTCGAMAKLCPERCCYTADGYYCIECSERRRAHVVLAAIERALGFRVPRQRAPDLHLACGLCIQRHTRLDQNALGLFYRSLLVYGRTAPAQATRLAQSYDLKDLHNLVKLHLYRAGLMLCRRHHKSELAACVTTFTDVFSTQADVLDVVLEWRRSQRQLQDTLFQKRDRAALSALLHE